VIQATYAGDSAFLASASTPVTLTITQPMPTSAGPAVTSVQRFGIHMMPTSLVLTFSQPLDASRATDLSNYHIVGPDGRAVTIASASYDAASQSVTLHPAKQIDVHKTYRLTINGQTSSGVSDTSGVHLDGLGVGGSGTDYTTTITKLNLVIDGQHPFVQGHAPLMGLLNSATRHPKGPALVRGAAKIKAHR
jgi:hypothetical protein